MILNRTSLFNKIILLFFISFVLAFESYSQNEQKIKGLLIVNNEQELMNPFPPEYQFMIKTAARRAFMKAYPGGDNYYSYSMNGQFAAIKEDDPGMPEYQYDEITRLIKIIDIKGDILWSGKTLRHIIISNNGKYFVATDLAVPYVVNFYNMKESKPIKTYHNIDLSEWMFYENSEYIFFSSERKMILFSAIGDKIQETEWILNHGGSAFSKDGYIMILEGYPEEFYSTVTPMSNKNGQRLTRSRKGGSVCFTLMRNNEIIKIYKKKSYGRGPIRKITISNNNDSFIIAYTGCVEKYSSITGELLWEYRVSRQSTPCDIRDVAFSNNNRNVVILYSEYPGNMGFSHTSATFLNENGHCTEYIQFKPYSFSTVAYTNDDQYVVLVGKKMYGTLNSPVQSE